MLRLAMFALLAVLSVHADAQDRVNRLNIGLKAHKITVDGLERNYRVVVPPRITNPMPLVLVLHGGGFGDNGALHVIRYTQFTPLALREGFIVVYPMGVDGNWNDGRDVEFIRAQKENIDDVKFMRAVVDEVAKSHPVDRSRVFSTGISNGAFMSNRLAADASDLVAAVAPVVGGMSPTLAKRFAPEYPVSVLVVQGDSDPLVPFDGGVVGMSLGKGRGITVKSSEVVAKYLKRNGIKDKPEVKKLDDKDADDGTTTEARIYPDGESGAKVRFYIVKNGGHTWPGKRQYLTEKLVGKTAQDFDATEAIWEFFKSCPPRRLKTK